MNNPSGKPPGYEVYRTTSQNFYDYDTMCAPRVHAPCSFNAPCYDPTIATLSAGLAKHVLSSSRWPPPVTVAASQVPPAIAASLIRHLISRAQDALRGRVQPGHRLRENETPSRKADRIDQCTLPVPGACFCGCTAWTAVAGCTWYLVPAVSVWFQVMGACIRA